jgi:hypothetical protein
LSLASDRDQAKFSEEAANTAKARKEAILEEIKQLGDHERAGVYFAGDGLGANTLLTLAPRTGYVFEWHGCLGVYDRNYGPVTWTGQTVRLSFTFENVREGFQGIAPEFVPVSWGTRRYLIPPDEIIAFCNSVNDGEEPRKDSFGQHLLRRDDEGKEVSGFPAVPDEYRPYLLSAPIEAAIIGVGTPTICTGRCDLKIRDTPVTLDTGSAKGLRVGMKLTVSVPEDMMESVRITKVETDRSEGIMSQIQLDEKEPLPKAGWRLSTRAPWYSGSMK